ncbi:MAG: polymorphic toxin-type HINT domain-containing protein, partial [Planctomycetaceae bacterium]
MNSTGTNRNQLRALFFAVLCLLGGLMCFVTGLSHNPATFAASSCERQSVSAPSAFIRDVGKPHFTSLTPRYVTKRIADLEVGEEVVAKDPESGEVTTKRVANVFRKVSDHLRILQVRNPLTNELQTIETTDDHPFWVRALGQWIDAKNLKLGDRLDDVDGGTAILESTSRELHPEGIPVFNFEVEDFHTYFVRAHGSRGPPVLTHNVDCNKFQTIIDASPTNSVGLGSNIAVGTPGIDDLPG